MISTNNSMKLGLDAIIFYVISCGMVIFVLIVLIHCHLKFCAFCNCIVQLELTFRSKV